MPQGRVSAALPNRPDFRVTCARTTRRRHSRASRVHTDAFSIDSDQTMRKRAKKNWSVTLPFT
jgi:hypothetical protein